MIRVEGNDCEVEGTLVDLTTDAAVMLTHIYAIASEALGTEEAERIVLVRLPKLVRDSVRRKR